MAFLRVLSSVSLAKTSFNITESKFLGTESSTTRFRLLMVLRSSTSNGLMRQIVTVSSKQVLKKLEVPPFGVPCGVQIGPDEGLQAPARL